MKIKDIAIMFATAVGAAALAIAVSKSQYQTNAILTIWDIQNAQEETYVVHKEQIPAEEQTGTTEATQVVVELVDKQEEEVTPEVATPPVSDEEIRQEAEETLKVYEVNLPDEIKAYCEEVGQQYGICPELLEAIAWRESRYQGNATNGTCTGIMQVSYVWHGDRMQRLGVSSLYDVQGCIKVAADYIAELADGGETAVATALMTYNGDSRANEEGYTSAYAQDILTVSAALERVHGK